MMVAYHSTTSSCRCGRSSVVERNVANVDVEGSTPFARS
jgi:hypothetical protein